MKKKEMQQFPNKGANNKNSFEATRFKSILNPYFSFTHNNDNELALHESLVQEALQIKGDVFLYVPREYVNIDEVFGEDIQSSFKEAWPFAAYIINYESFSGAGAFFSKFGYEADDEIELEFNPALFAHQVNNMSPQAGDLVYAPKINCLFEITYVQPTNPYGQLGSTQALRKLNCIKFTASHEEMDIDINIDSHFNVPEFALDEVTDKLNGLNGRATSRIDGNDYAEVDQAKSDLEGVLHEYILDEGSADNDHIVKENSNVIDPFEFYDK